MLFIRFAIVTRVKKNMDMAYIQLRVGWATMEDEEDVIHSMLLPAESMIT